jgi:predicted dehydrogenase
VLGNVPYGDAQGERLRVALVGCGGQAFRSILPSLQYAPVELVATCDVVEERAEEYARRFGAQRAWTDYGEMLVGEQMDAVLLVAGYDQDSVPVHAALAAQAVRAGLHVWMEKPPAASSAEVRELDTLAAASGRHVAVGFMKMFSAGMLRILRLMADGGLGKVTSIALRDPELLPPVEARADPRRTVLFLDHIVHGASVLRAVGGDVERVYVEDGWNGAAVAALRFTSGAVGTLHLPWGQSGTSPVERLEVVGEGANVVFENGIRLRYHQRGARGSTGAGYGRAGEFTTDVDQAPLVWEIDGYSGQPFNMHIFYQGYAPAIIHFARSVLADRPVELGGLDDAWHVMRLVEALLEPPGQVVSLAA